MKLSAPVLMAASLNVLPDSPHTIFDMARLCAPNREPLMVSEIRFYSDFPLAVESSDMVSYGPINPGPEIRVSIHAGPFAVCEDVPVWSLAPPVDQVMELRQWRWRLMKPLFLPPGMGMRISVRRSLVPGVLASYPVLAGAMPIWCTVVGHILEGDTPKTMTVPFASTFAPAPTLIAASGLYVSTQQDLLNNTSSPIALKYAIGRLGLVSGLVAGATIQAQTIDSSDAGIDVVSRCQLSHNKVRLIPQDSEFNAAFDYAHRMMRLSDYELPMGDRLTFNMKHPVGTPAEWRSSGYGDYWAPVVTIVGSRRESVP